MSEHCGDERILDLVQGLLPEEQARDVREHLAACAPCRAAADEIGALAKLAQGPAPQPSPGIDQAVQAEIARLAAPRRPTTRINLPAVRRFRLFRLMGQEGTSARFAAAVAAAAVFVVAVVLAVAISGPSRPDTAQAPARDEAPPPPPENPPPQPPPAPPGRDPAPLPPPVVPLPDPAPERRAPDPAPPPPAPAPGPRTPQPPAVAQAPTVTEEKKVPAARIVALAGKAEAAGAAAAEGDTLSFGDAFTCRTGTALLELADGTRLGLRADTACTLAQSGAEVRVKLARGEAAFQVRRQPDRFVVETAHGQVTVKGTFFSVRTGLLSSVIVVGEGRVEVRNAKGAQVLGAGQQGSMNGGAPSKPQPIDAERQLAWASRLGVRSRGAAFWAARGGEFQAPMTAGRPYAEGSLSGAPVYSPSKTYTINGRANGGWVTYAVDLPEEGEWFLWGRFYYPGSNRVARHPDGGENDPNSFWVSVDGGNETEFGNLRYDEARRSYFRRWHWAGDGTAETGRAVPVALGRLSKGRHTIRVRERESFEDGELRLAPRLDMLCLTPDRDYVPQDEDARR